MNFWILDTDTFSLFQRAHLLVVQRVNTIPTEQLATTIVTFEEQMYGRMNRIRRADSQESLVFAYIQLNETLKDFKTINVLDYNQEAANCYTELRRQKIRIGTQDLRIASIAITNNGILVTRNQRDFCRVLELKFEDWTLEN
ncbi:nucleic acid-binding protein, contains PIN domain protein [Nostoc linckia z18]|uniref:Nucleic acid-binding protein, contains PIN domain protein n=2 Tax=Nostoc linckia TaxID=92942 RepID=A0A9Q5ZBN4_NOSLI|nr:type II toxin-antitoxin system VapC family toxin [Nostoc linckia]PHK39065.1 nucleic acid-binding protein, contains PIN domain protein [Nostoc linckia z16]PHK41207.1 nucleic acid-binding protein, contains PIN domain protein [Nostoc linckia z15]PHJ62412.1 nucleic acid-binding protein, contains PIN domain protein [Nostoc linckia z1]PHJ62486.1 nucleic acid-binding protein, contains PIN domain protein [Nostoc linckia z3]PHJ71245.1 nucleic acid-binding protein, contains PIN domain protein [Nostoc